MIPATPNVSGATVHKYAEHQPEYHTIDVAVVRNEEYGCYQLVTAWTPSDEELERFAGALDEAIRTTPIREPTTVLLRKAFAKRPIVLALLSGDGRLTPQNLYLGMPPHLTP